MQVDLTLDDLNALLEWHKHSGMIRSTPNEEDVLAGRLSSIKLEAEEIASLDLDDCAGGACKL